MLVNGSWGTLQGRNLFVVRTDYRIPHSCGCFTALPCISVLAACWTA